jgi:2-oxoglutarate ferredoxin oxidoreductase subunit gamma
MVMVGFFTAVTGLLGRESARKAVADSVPGGTEALNQAAFDKGYAYGKEQVGELAAANPPGDQPVRALRR